MTRPASRHVAKLVVALCVLSVVLVFAAFQFGSEHTWWIELARYIPFPAYLAPAGLAVVMSLWLSARWRIAAAASLALVLTGIMGLQISRGEEGHAPLRLMTYNIKAYLADDKPGGFAQIAWEIALHDPDVLVMQDAGAAGKFDELPQPLRTALGSRNIHFSGQYMIASRHPMQDCREVVAQRYAHGCHPDVVAQRVSVEAEPTPQGVNLFRGVGAADVGGGQIQDELVVGADRALQDLGDAGGMRQHPLDAPGRRHPQVPGFRV